MSRYSKMQAPPFWMWMFRIAGIACLVTLITPTLYLLKYQLHDYPQEVKLAGSATTNQTTLSAPAFVQGTEWYIANAEGKQPPGLRVLAVERLGELASSTFTQITHPVECLHAKLALEQVASADPNPNVRSDAQSVLMHVAAHGAVVSR
jgi:hypothetical protein